MEGRWVQGKSHGQIIETDAEGTVLKALYEHGKLVKYITEEEEEEESQK